VRHEKHVPLLVKIAPNSRPRGRWRRWAAALRSLEVEGVIATNTSTDLSSLGTAWPEGASGGLERRSAASIVAARHQSNYAPNWDRTFPSSASAVIVKRGACVGRALARAQISYKSIRALPTEEIDWCKRYSMPWAHRRHDCRRHHRPISTRRCHLHPAIAWDATNSRNCAPAIDLNLASLSPAPPRLASGADDPGRFVEGLLQTGGRIPTIGVSFFDSALAETAGSA